MEVKFLKKKYQEKWENAYLTVKNARAPRALRQALDPGQYWLASLARLRFAMLARSQENFCPPPDQILDPLLHNPSKQDGRQVPLILKRTVGIFPSQRLHKYSKNSKGHF